MIAAYLSQIGERAHCSWIHGLREVLLHKVQQLLLQLLHLSDMPRLSALSRAMSPLGPDQPDAVHATCPHAEAHKASLSHAPWQHAMAIIQDDEAEGSHLLRVYASVLPGHYSGIQRCNEGCHSHLQPQIRSSYLLTLLYKVIRCQDCLSLAVKEAPSSLHLSPSHMCKCPIGCALSQVRACVMAQA